MAAQRLSPQDWIDAALKGLADTGHQALRAEKLAVELGVSRGSFYWHFADVSVFEHAVLDRWEALAVDAPYSQAVDDHDASASEVLTRLIRSAFQAPVRLEQAVRSWAAVCDAAASAVERVDQRRVALIARLLRNSGTPAGQATTSAVLLYWTYLGHVSTASTMPIEGVVPTLIELVSRPE